MKQVVFIHGGEDFPTYEKYLESLKNYPVTIDEFLPKKRWKNNLQQDLGDDFQVFAPQMPNKENAKYIEWKIWFEKMFPFLDDDVVLVGYSLGGIFLPMYLSENKFPKKIKAIVLVSPPYDSEGLEPPLADFQLKDPLSNMSDQCENIFIVHGTDDPVVPYKHAQKYLNDLPMAELITIEGGDHFSQPEFPELVELIKSIR
jgi:predicted alpha/beta hydrolase family esterase